MRVDWSRFVSVEVLGLALGSLIAGGAAWSDVKSDIRENQTRIEEQEKIQSERYNDLKDGQRQILDHLLKEDT